MTSVADTAYRADGYTVVYQLGPGGKNEFWLVPTSSPANLATVRTTPRTGVAGQAVSIQYVNSALATKADDSSVVHVNGTETISGTKTFASAPNVPAPTSAGQVASKCYVDAVANVGAGNYLPTAGGTLTGPLTLPGGSGCAAAGDDEAICGFGTGCEIGFSFGAGSGERIGDGAGECKQLSVREWDVGAVRRGRDRESVKHSDGEPDDCAAGGNNIFDQQPGEYPLCDVELELGADAGGQSGGARECDDSPEPMPTGDRYRVEHELLHVQGVHLLLHCLPNLTLIVCL